MLRYLAPVTLGVCAVSAGIFSAKPAPSKSSNCVSSAVARLLVAARCHSGGTGLAETMDYTDEAERMAQRVYELYSDSDWKVAKTSKDIRILYKKSAEFDGYVYRAECTLDASPERILKYILPTPKGLRGKWDKNVKESEVIEHINKDLIVARSATHSAAMGLISSRDFLDLIYVKRYPTNNMVCTHSKSIKRKDCPPRDGFVRGTNYHGGTFCVPVDGESNRTRVVNMVQSDLGGMLPQTLVDSALPSNLVDFFVDLDNALKSNIE
ncbi:stAR-related lipid transfer protein 5-like isoform X2 [Acanthaster planci]|uniref:StAR-related lipid transfer protein 5-like isoform X2 n=1 Tax=Acanthaster planci TaxID=133434 RepID=A0A8B7Z7P9_ACAPL|nr:stAR-related lipid transfer protein 5-like isoform X2 [Acanthaster planci]